MTAGFDIAARTSRLLAGRYRDAARARREFWRGSPFRWMVFAPPGTKGSMGETILRELISQAGGCHKPARGCSDRCIGAKRVEVKLSTGYSEGELFSFQQIRPEGYDYVAMLGLQPRGAWLWWCTLEEAVKHSEPMHNEESRWIRFPVGEPPWWLGDGAIVPTLERIIGDCGCGTMFTAQALEGLKT